MTLNFCTRTARKIRRLEYAHKVAVHLSGFFYISMTSVCGLMGAMLCPSLKSMAGEEAARLLRLAIIIPSQVLINQITGSGRFFTGARTGIPSPAFSGLRRN